MAEDISITIKADPTQAVNGINTAKKAATDLGETAKQTNAEMKQSTAAGNHAISVSAQAAQALGKTSSAVNGVAGDVGKLGREASKISGAFGDSIPIIGKMGSALSAVLAGPVGLISAAIAAAGALITKMIDDAKAKIEAMNASASAQGSAAYDRVMQGRRLYEDQLATLARVKEMNAAAKQSPLDKDEVAKLWTLAERLGIDRKNVSSSGVNVYALDRAEKQLAHDRMKDAQREYGDYLAAMQKQFNAAIKASDLDSGYKDVLLKKSLFDQVKYIEHAAQGGWGQDVGTIRAFQDLYGLAKQVREVQTTYNRDSMRGRDQSVLDAELVEGVKSGVQSRLDEAAERKKTSEAIFAAGRKEAAAIRAAEESAQKEAARRQEASDKLTRKYRDEIEIQQLIVDGKKREAEILRQRISMEAALGRQLNAEELSNLENLVGTLYDLRNPNEPSLAPVAPDQESAPVAPDQESAAVAAATSRGRQFAMPLDRLQRIGANGPASVTSPEKMIMDKQLSVQEDIRRFLYQSAAQTYKETVMRF